MTNECVDADSDVELNVDIRSELLSFNDAEWPDYIEKSLLQMAVSEASHNVQVSKAMAFTSALGAMSTACQGLIQVKQPTGNIVNTNLSLLTIAESGERKTSIEKLFFRSIRDLQTELMQRAVDERKAFERKMRTWKVRYSVAEKVYKKAYLEHLDDPENIDLLEESEDCLQQLEDVDKQKPEPPVEIRFIYDDSTPQALVRKMNDHYRHACLLSSEANGMFNGKVFEDLHLLNSLWDGIDITVDRTSMPSFVLADARLTLALMAQMRVLNTFLFKRGQEARGLGFLARFLVVRPHHLAGHRDANKTMSELENVNLFNERIRALMLRDIESNKGRDPKTRPPKTMLKFTADAGELWSTYARHIEEEQQKYGKYEFYTDHASKLMDNMSRVAGIIHYFHDESEKDSYINKTTLAYAYQVCMRYSKHFMKYIAEEPLLIQRANKLIEYLYKPPATSSSDGYDQTFTDRFNPEKQYQVRKARQISGIPVREGRVIKFTVREVQSFVNFEDKDEVKRVLALLQDLGFVKLQDGVRQTAYEFHEALIYNTGTDSIADRDPVEPKLKNGEEYTISSLPLFEEMIAFKKKQYTKNVFDPKQSAYPDVTDVCNEYKPDYLEGYKYFIKCKHVLRDYT